MTTIAVTKERRAGETRVAATPETVKKFIGAGYSVVIEAGAGAAAFALVELRVAVIGGGGSAVGP